MQSGQRNRSATGTHRRLPSAGNRDGRLRVLAVVREHTDLLRLRYLSRQSRNLSISWCNSPNLVLEILGRRRFDVMVWEEHLFEGDQEGFLRVLSQQSTVPVVVMGSSRAEPYIRNLIVRGAADYLGKYELGSALLVRTLRRAVYRKLSEKEHDLREQVDALTGILDRRLFHDRFQQALLRAERDKSRVGLMFLNVDNFRSINQHLGYQNGDLLIKMLATRLRRELRQSDTLARVGGDEFAVILESVGEELSLSDVAQKLLNAFQKPFPVKEKALEVTASMGVACFPDEGRSQDELMQHAHEAMFEAKKEDGCSYRFFDQKRNAELKKRLALEGDLRKAIRGNQLQVFYQPKMDITTGAITGMEALLRWPHPRFGMLSPNSFIPVAERTSLIIPMGYWVIQQTCQDLAVLQAAGNTGLHCSVNLSFRQFHDRKLAQTVFRIIYSSEIDTTGFEFELTESAMMYDREYTLNCLNELKHLGLNFSLDDFGTGYSSFSNLRSLPISTVKIDKSFVERLEESEDDRTLVSGMISLAHNLNMTVVAEGVETPGQLAFLRDQRCDLAQGYLIAKPMPFAEFRDFLAQSQKYPLDLTSQS